MATKRIQRSGRRPLALLGAALGLTGVAACGETTVNAPLPAARVEAVASTAPRGRAGQVLPAPVEVRVIGTDDQPLPGATVNFSAASGGSVSPAATTTDGSGLARTQWTLGQTAGPNVLTASAGSVSTTITATVTADRAASVALVAGNNQTAPAGGTVPVPPSVRVTDAFGNLVADAPVTFTVLSGGGRVTGGLRLTNAQGIATVGSWILGPAVGEHTLAARVEENGVANNPIIFTATASAPTGSQIVKIAGDSQQVPVGRLVPIPPTVAVRNSDGSGVPGVVVTFAVASGGGSVIGSRQVTDATGTASVGGWILGNLPGTNTLTASAPGLPDVTFTATGTAGLPASIAAVSQTTQTATAGANVSDPPSVIVRDAQGNPVPGVVVTFAVTTGGGSVVGSPDTTNASGIATLVSWQLGLTPGLNTVSATAAGSGITGNPVTFTAQGVPQVVVTAAPTGPVNRGDPFTISVQLRNAAGTPVQLAGVPLTIAIATGGGTLGGTPIQTTDATGAASFTGLTVNGGVGARTFTISGAGVTPATTAAINFN